MQILICPDKFKGTLDANQAARAIARGWRRARPKDSINLLPMSDGGDGFGTLLGNLLECETRRIITIDAAHRPCYSSWWWRPAERLAIIESARTIGLAMLPACSCHPFELDTFGLGAVVKAASVQSPAELLVGIGGSATNDGGFGLARALGWSFCDARGRSIEKWTELHRLRTIVPPASQPSPETQVIVAVDVTNPLLGSSGASRVYGPQKGLRPQDFRKAERCLGQLAEVARQFFQRDFSVVPGAGAAGGLGFGLAAFFSARLEPGFDLFAKHAHLEEHLRSTDLVITGEGKIDASSLMGKGVGNLAARCAKLKIPCLGLAGTLGNQADPGPFTRVLGMTELTSPDKAMTAPGFWLERLATKAAREFEFGPQR